PGQGKPQTVEYIRVAGTNAQRLVEIGNGLLASACLSQCIPEGIKRRGVVRFEGDGLSVLGDGLAVLPLTLQGDAEIGVRQGVIGPQDKSLPVLGNRLIVLTLVPQGDTQAGVHV